MDPNQASTGLPNIPDSPQTPASKPIIIQPSPQPTPAAPSALPSVPPQPLVNSETEASPSPPFHLPPGATTSPEPQSFQAPEPPVVSQTFTPAEPTAVSFAPDTSAGVTFGTGGSPAKRKRKKLLLAGAAAVLLLLVPAVVFGYYLPNKPSRIYAAGINRSGKALNSLVSAATEKSRLEAYKKSDISLAVDANYGEGSYSGSFNAKFDSSKAEGGLNFTAKTKGRPDQSLNTKFMGELPAGSQYPNIYLQFNGLKTLGVDSYLPAALALDGKWISITSEYLQSLGSVPTAQERAKKELTSSDFAELANAATSVTTEYVFSTESSKAIFIYKSFEGKEKADNMNTYHYKVSLNKDHVIAYCKAMVEKIYSTNAYKKIPWVNENNVDKDKEAAIKDCDSSGKDTKTDMTYDLWIDAKYKLIYKFRIPDSTDKDVYTEVGQIYKGGDNVSMFVNYHDGKNKADGKFTLDTNIKTLTTKGVFTMTGGTADNTYDIKLTLDAKPYTGEINTTKPPGAVPIQDILKQLGIDPVGLLA